MNDIRRPRRLCGTCTGPCLRLDGRTFAWRGCAIAPRRGCHVHDVYTRSYRPEICNIMFVVARERGEGNCKKDEARITCVCGGGMRANFCRNKGTHANCFNNNKQLPTHVTFWINDAQRSTCVQRLAIPTIDAHCSTDVDRILAVAVAAVVFVGCRHYILKARLMFNILPTFFILMCRRSV